MGALKVKTHILNQPKKEKGAHYWNYKGHSVVLIVLYAKKIIPTDYRYI